MQKRPRQPAKWQAARKNRAAATLIEINASIADLHAECLLDLHDIFRSRAGSALAEMAEAELARRGVKPPA